jgi:putative hydrolase of the HAD superfamily
VGWEGFAAGEAICFDLDDTLIADSAAADDCWQQACAEAAAVGPVAATQLREAVRRVGAWYWADPERHRVGRLDLLAATVAIVRDALAELGCADDPLAIAVARRYRALRDERTELFDGALETLTTLGRAGHRLALITNGAAGAQRAKLERFALSSYFDYIGVEGEVGVGKPDPEAYERALRALGVKPQNAWMVGDNLVWDVRAAQDAGLRAIWIDRARAGLPANAPARPDHIATSVVELVVRG